jgi:hypothetical protein
VWYIGAFNHIGDKFADLSRHRFDTGAFELSAGQFLRDVKADCRAFIGGFGTDRNAEIDHIDAIGGVVEKRWRQSAHHESRSRSAQAVVVHKSPLQSGR